MKVTYLTNGHESGDWREVYVDGVCMFAGHSIPDSDWLYLLHMVGQVDVEIDQEFSFEDS